MNKLGWELCKDEAGIKTWFKQLSDSPTYHIKMNGKKEIKEILLK